MSKESDANPKRLRVAMLVKTQAAMRQAVAYLYRRGVDVVFAKSLKELIQIMTDSIKAENKFSVVYVSVNFPHQRIDTIPGLIEKSFAVTSIVFAEDADRRSTAKLSAVQAPNVVYGVLSGPAAYLRLQNILKKDEMAASMKRQQKAAKEATTAVADQVKAKRKAAKEANEAESEEKNQKNRMVYIKSDKAEARTKSFYHFKKDDPSAVPIADEGAFQALLAEANQDVTADENGGFAAADDAVADETPDMAVQDPLVPEENSDLNAAVSESSGDEPHVETESDMFLDSSKINKISGASPSPEAAENNELLAIAAAEPAENEESKPTVDPVFAASSKPQEDPRAGESYIFNSDPAKSHADDLHATVEHVSFHHPTTRDERMFDDVIKRCARATLSKLKANVADMPLSKRAHNEAKLISIKAKKIAGTVFLSTGLSGRQGILLLNKAVDIFLEKAVERGINPNIADIMVCGIDDAPQIISDLHETNFAMCGQTPEFHLMITFIHGLDIFPKISEPEAGHYSVSLSELGIGQKIPFDLFLKLSLNNKFIRYLRPGLSLTKRQAEKLQKYLIETLYVHEKDMQELREFKVVQNLKSSKKKSA